MRLKALIVVMLIVLTGCSAETPVVKPEPATIKLVPVDLFKGNAAKLKLFLGPMTGAFTLAYEGEKPNAYLDIDIWKNGQKVESAGSIGDLFFSHEDTTSSGEIEIIISIDNPVSISGNSEFGTIKVSTIHQSGSGLYTFTIPWDKKLSTKGLIQDTEPSSFSAGDPVHVFGMHATSTNSIRVADFSPESLSRMEWALLFTLRFEE